jgi:glyceraldehyde-3-phosphate dehydrogenase/erythrose-4-phosphate dehydrogenase
MRVQAVQNGFGRFGLHMLAYYLDRAETSNFSITHINDEKLSISQMIEIVRADRYVRLYDLYKIEIEGSILKFIKGDLSVSIEFHNLPLHEFIGFGNGIFLECSGRYTDVQRFPAAPNIERVFISATSINSDITAIVG